MALRNLRIGMTGLDVKAVQQGLNIRDGGVQPPLVEDGIFGKHTDQAVRDYQNNHRLEPDGIVGRLTRCSLFSLAVATVVVNGVRRQAPGSLNPAFATPRPFGLPPDSPYRTNAAGTLQPPKLESDFGFPQDSPYRTYRSAHPQIQAQGSFALAPWNGGNGGALSCYNYGYLKVPCLPLPLPAPQMPNWNLTIPPLLSRQEPWKGPFGFVYNHIETQPGVQSTFDGKKFQNAFGLAMQYVFVRGPADRGHQEGNVGFSFNSDVVNGGAWTYTYFVQVSDVDRFGPVGDRFHWWQPYAQLGYQMNALHDPQSTLTGSVSPLSLSVDIIKDTLAIGLSAGVVWSFNLLNGTVSGGGQVTGGITWKTF